MSEIKTNKISSLASNNDITIDPDGTGDTIILSGNLGIGDATPNALLTMVAADGIMADQYVAKFTNSEATAGQNYGVFVAGGSTSADESFSVRKFDNSATYFKVRGDGNVAIGHASPTAPLDVRISGASGLIAEFHNNSGFGVDIGSDSDSVAYVSGGYTQALTFKTNAGSGQVERMRILSDGRLLIGTASELFSQGVLQVKGNGAQNIARFGAGANAESIIFENSSGTAVGSIQVNASATAFNTSSDYRLKKEVTYNWDATTRLKELKPARFKWIADGDDAEFVDGFIAHELTAVPDAVSGKGKDAVDDDGNPVLQGVDQSKIVPLLVKTILELEARITALEAE